jgi:hypothetical protein
MDTLIIRLCVMYADNALAHIQQVSLRDPFTGEQRPVDYRLLESIERYAGVTRERAEAFRMSVIGYTGLHRGILPALHHAVEAKVRDDWFPPPAPRFEALDQFAQREPVEWKKEGF